MFYNCTSLIEFTGNLEAREVKSRGCYQMFKNCYFTMFSDCSKLESVTMLATDISADSCLNGWLKNTSSHGVLYRPASLMAGLRSTISNYLTSGGAAD